MTDLPGSTQIQPRETEIQLPSLTIGGLFWAGRALHGAASVDGLSGEATLEDCAKRNAPFVVAMHGWLDNAASFAWLAPLLAAQGVSVFAPDWPGHGASSHRPEGTLYHLVDNIVVLEQILQCLSPQRGVLLGHSMGGVIAQLHAAARTEYADSQTWPLIVLDALGPMSSAAEQTPAVLGKGLRRVCRGTSPVPAFDDLGMLIQNRMAGFGGLSSAAAELILRRNLTPDATGRWRWRSDPRLRWPSLLRMTEAQVLACLAVQPADSLVLLGDRGFFANPGSAADRRAALGEHKIEFIPGPHHLHLDGDLAVLSRRILTFLSRPTCFEDPS